MKVFLVRGKLVVFCCPYSLRFYPNGFPPPRAPEAIEVSDQTVVLTRHSPVTWSPECVTFGTPVPVLAKPRTECLKPLCVPLIVDDYKSITQYFSSD